MIVLHSEFCMDRTLKCTVKLNDMEVSEIVILCGRAVRNQITINGWHINLTSCEFFRMYTEIAKQIPNADINELIAFNGKPHFGGRVSKLTQGMKNYEHYRNNH